MEENLLDKFYSGKSSKKEDEELRNKQNGLEADMFGFFNSVRDDNPMSGVDMSDRIMSAIKQESRPDEKSGKIIFLSRRLVGVAAAIFIALLATMFLFIKEEDYHRFDNSSDELQAYSTLLEVMDKVSDAMNQKFVAVEHLSVIERDGKMLTKLNAINDFKLSLEKLNYLKFSFKLNDIQTSSVNDTADNI
ncbi:MAG: hypothetical protein N4A72_06765 [Bacteroidales bacterium]|jgi:hypothetical protein|nr:hypothetical protein [Bacteroidales bacterium]